jgi:hypothetical protein
MQSSADKSNPIQPAMGISYPPTQEQKASVMSFEASKNDDKPFASHVQSAAINRDHTPTQKAVMSNPNQPEMEISYPPTQEQKASVMSFEASKNDDKPFASHVQSAAINRDYEGRGL